MEGKKLLKSIFENPWIVLGVVYVVGIFLHAFDKTYDLTILITPYVILLTIIYVIYISEIYKNRYLLLVLGIIALIGFIAEILGSNWGYVFGDYLYGNVLGPKLFGVPVIIALNWAFVIYGCYALVRRYISKKLIILLMVPVAVVIFDIIMEPVAIELGYWAWDNVDVPLFNYFSWYVISIISVILLIISESKNDLGKEELKAPSILFLTQLLFFSILSIIV